MGLPFDKALRALPDNGYNDALITSTHGAAYIFEGYQTSDIAVYYIAAFNMSGLSAELLSEKFANLHDSVTKLDETDTSLSLAAGDLT